MGLRTFSAETSWWINKVNGQGDVFHNSGTDTQLQVQGIKHVIKCCGVCDAHRDQKQSTQLALPCKRCVLPRTILPEYFVNTEAVREESAQERSQCFDQPTSLITYRSRRRSTYQVHLTLALCYRHQKALFWVCSHFCSYRGVEQQALKDAGGLEILQHCFG